MHWIRLLFFVVTLLGTPILHGQQKADFRFRNELLSEALVVLEKSFAIQFAFSSDQVDLTQRITLELNQSSLDQTLSFMLRHTGIAYTVSGNVVALYPDPAYRVTISGTIREEGSGERLIGVLIGTDPQVAGTVSDAYGTYTLSVPPGKYEVVFNYVGFLQFRQTLSVNRSQELNVQLKSSSQLEEVVVSASSGKEHQNNVISIPMQEIKSVPVILGEKDVVKYAMLFPGVQKGSEGNSYLFVRGGGPDQNLVLIDDAVIYNAYHFLGLASLFSGSELRYAELIKGGFSSRYGGRLSSVLNMSMKDGNRERFGFDGTIGTIASRLLIEGPISKNKASYLISFRKSYIDKVSSMIAKDQNAVLDYGFYDVHAKVSADLGKSDRIMLSGYIGNDQMNNGSDPSVVAYDDGITWGNRVASLKWNHRFNSDWMMNTAVTYSNYRSRSAFAQQDGTEKWYSSAVESDISDITVKSETEYTNGHNYRFRGGAGFTRHYFNPLTAVTYLHNDSGFVSDQRFSAGEAFGFGEWEFRFHERWKLVSGLRFSYYRNNSTFIRAEPRINLEYTPGKNWLLTGTYTLMNQYMHLISAFGGFGFPNDLWVSSDENLMPQRSNLLTFGVSRIALFDGSFSVSAEAYYKDIQNAVGMKENTSFFMVLPVPGVTNRVSKWSEITTQGQGTSYGAELMFRRSAKRFSGWVSYTLSKTEMQFDDLNNGLPFPATYDRRHDFGVYLKYSTPRHWQFSVSWVYGTGNAISLPVGEYYASQSDVSGNLSAMMQMPDIEKKNNYRMKDYHRLDISTQYKHRLGNRLTGVIELSVYNLYNRANPFFYQIEYENTSSGVGKRKLQQMSLFPVMPSLSWTITL